MGTFSDWLSMSQNSFSTVASCIDVVDRVAMERKMKKLEVYPNSHLGSDVPISLCSLMLIIFARIDIVLCIHSVQRSRYIVTKFPPNLSAEIDIATGLKLCPLSILQFPHVVSQ